MVRGSGIGGRGVVMKGGGRRGWLERLDTMFGWRRGGEQANEVSACSIYCKTREAQSKMRLRLGACDQKKKSYKVGQADPTENSTRGAWLGAMQAQAKEKNGNSPIDRQKEHHQVKRAALWQHHRTCAYYWCRDLRNKAGEVESGQ